MNISLYIHVPFCEKKCRYCDFYSIERMHQKDEFVQMVTRELALRATMVSQQHSVKTIFFGGGTPSLLSPTQFQTIGDAIHNHYHIDTDCEWTMECNPGTVTLENLQQYKTSGVNRISFGVQSFHQAELEFLDRIHSPEDAETAVELARTAGIHNINIDLMFALPHQTKETFTATLQRALALNTEHISAYSLIYEEGTPLFAMLQKGEVSQSSEETDAEMYQLAIETLTANGYSQYEISNFAKPGLECKHNLVYWNAEEYLSFGPSAHGFIHNSRYWNYRNISTYLQKLQNNELPSANSEVLSVSERMFERAFLELRAQGVRLDKFKTDFGIDITNDLKSTIQLWSDEHLVTLHNGKLSLTSSGYSVCDELTLQLISGLEKYTSSVWKPAPDNQYQDVFTIL
ncbi:MAG: radical SAM family heme chaperone HemW [Candidatus Kapaibacterium sp.]